MTLCLGVQATPVCRRDMCSTQSTVVSSTVFRSQPVAVHGCERRLCLFCATARAYRERRVRCTRTKRSANHMFPIGLYEKDEMNTIEVTICQILLRAEALYEQFGTPLVGVSRHRRAWAFARAFGATRLAREFGVARATVVTARRRAFARWHYWMTRYEEPLWQVLMRIAGEPRQWEGCMVRYRHLRAQLRQERVPAEHEEAQTDALVACALRSLASVPWRDADRDCWQTVWRLLARRQIGRAHQVATALGWSAMQWRRSRRVVSRLRALVWFPLSQRQLLALSGWPPVHLEALHDTGQALFPTHRCCLLQLVHLSPIQITCVGNIPTDTDTMSTDGSLSLCPSHATADPVVRWESEEPAYD